MMLELTAEQTPSCDGLLAGLSSCEPEVSLNLHLIRFLIDRSNRRNSGKPEVIAKLQRCKEMLRDVMGVWRSHREGTARVTARAFYELQVLISTIERLMGQMPPESEDFLRLHRCIVLLDEVDRTLEKSAVSTLEELSLAS